MIEVPLHNRRHEVIAMAVVDDEDRDLVCQYNWSLSGEGYAVTSRPHPIGGIYANGKARRYLLSMQRLVLGLVYGERLHGEHHNHDTLDNRRTNLRRATSSQNHGNTISTTGSSRFKGVYWNKNAGKWMAQLRHKDEQRYLGLFVDESEAAKAYDREALKVWGEFAHLNDPKEPDVSIL